MQKIFCLDGGGGLGVQPFNTRSAGRGSQAPSKCGRFQYRHECWRGGRPDRVPMPYPPDPAPSGRRCRSTRGYGTPSAGKATTRLGGSLNGFILIIRRSMTAGAGPYCSAVRLRTIRLPPATVKCPGKKVRQKAGLNRSILDQGWGVFRRQLDYKLAWTGGWPVPVPAPVPTPTHRASQTCSCCVHVDPVNRRSQSVLLCQQCWYENHADEVGAINILNRALAWQAQQWQDHQGQDMPGSPVK